MPQVFVFLVSSYICFELETFVNVQCRRGRMQSCCFDVVSALLSTLTAATPALRIILSLGDGGTVVPYHRSYVPHLENNGFSIPCKIPKYKESMNQIITTFPMLQPARNVL